MTPLDSSISSSSSSNSQDMGTSTATIAVTSSESMSNAVTSLKTDLSLTKLDHQPSSPNMRDASSTITIATINNLASKDPSSRDSNIDHKKASKVSKLSPNDHSSYELLQLFDKNGGNIDITAL